MKIHSALTCGTLNRHQPKGTMIFKVKNVSGGAAFWHALTWEAADLQDLAKQMDARVVNSCPGWAFLQAGETVSFEVTWTV